MLPCVCSCVAYLIWWVDGQTDGAPHVPIYRGGKKQEKEESPPTTAQKQQQNNNKTKPRNQQEDSKHIIYDILYYVYPRVRVPALFFLTYSVFEHHRIILLSHYMHTYLLSVRTASHNKYDGRKR